MTQENIAVIENNGYSEVTELPEVVESTEQLEQTEQVEQKPKRKVRRKAGKPKPIKVVLDAGNGRVKFAIGDYFDCFTSQWAVVKKLPRDIAGAFTLDGKHYIVGDDIDCIADAQDQGSVSSNGKIAALPLMLIAALTQHPDLLDTAPSVEKRSKDKKLLLYVEVLSLADGDELEESLRSVEKFSKDGVTYFLNIQTFRHRVEGYGAAIRANKIVQEKAPKTKKFHILDLGNGTSTITTYTASSTNPKAGLQRPGKGGGVASMLEHFSDKASIGDGKGATYDKLRRALERSRVEGDEYKTRASMSQDNIGASIKPALQDWISTQPAVVNTFTRVDELLADGSYVFCCGGGFAIATVAHFISSLEQFKPYVESGHLVILDEPATVALLGLMDE